MHITWPNNHNEFQNSEIKRSTPLVWQAFSRANFIEKEGLLPYRESALSYERALSLGTPFELRSCFFPFTHPNESAFRKNDSAPYGGPGDILSEGYFFRTP